MEPKLCIVCNINKNLTEFQFRKDTNKYRNICISCQKINYKKYYNENMDKKKKQVYSYKEKNKDKVKETLKNNYIKNIKCRKKYREKYYKEHKEEILIEAKIYRQENKDKLREYHKNYRRKKQKKDVNFRIRATIGSQIYNSIKGQKSGRNWEKILGYTLKDLLFNLEKQFDKNMSWNNYGSYWNIDHIIPIKLFNLSNEKELKKCWDLRNLRPLEKIENFKKNKRLNMVLIEEYFIKDLLPNNP